MIFRLHCWFPMLPRDESRAEALLTLKRVESVYFKSLNVLKVA